MPKKQIIGIAVLVVASVVVCTGMGLLHWGEAIYQFSDGERGWSLGASAYQALGWGAEAYRSDFGLDDAVDEGGVSDHAVVEVPVDHRGCFGHGFGGRRGRLGHASSRRGVGHLIFWALLAGLGVILFRRWREARSSPVSEK